MKWTIDFIAKSVFYLTCQITGEQERYLIQSPDLSNDDIQFKQKQLKKISTKHSLSTQQTTDMIVK